MYPHNRTLKDLLDRLKTMEKEEPDALNLPLIYQIHEKDVLESNSFSYVYFDPTLMHYYEDDGRAIDDGIKQPNAICIN